jgi:hypothetical protein
MQQSCEFKGMSHFCCFIALLPVVPFIATPVVTRYGQLIYNVTYRYEPFGCLTILFHTPVVFINSSNWSGDQAKLSSSVSALNISSLFSVSASQFLSAALSEAEGLRHWNDNLPLPPSLPTHPNL